MQNRLDDIRQHFERTLEIRRQLARENPGLYLADMAMTLNQLGERDRLQNRMDDALACYQEALSLFLKLAHADNKYAGAVARTQASLEEMEKGTNSRQRSYDPTRSAGKRRPSLRAPSKSNVSCDRSPLVTTNPRSSCSKSANTG